MKITVVAATRMELQLLIDHFGAVPVENSRVWTAQEGQLHFLVTGMGMMQTATHLAIYALQENRDLYIDAGIAGAFNRDIPTGAVLNVVSETYGDFGVEDGEEFRDFFEMGFIDRHEDAFEYGLLRPYGTLWQHEVLQDLQQVSSLTVNKVHGKEETIAMIMSRYRADIENMEGLAFFNVLHELKKESIQIRSISNYVERRNKDNWDIRLAISNLSDQLKAIIQSFLAD